MTEATRKLVEQLLSEEMTFSDLLGYTDSERIARSKTVRNRSLPVTSDKLGEVWSFAYKSNPSTTGTGWQGRIIFKEYAEAISADKHPVVVDCGCPDYQYKWAFANNDQQAGLIGPHSLNKNNGRYPHITNPHATPGLCKHLISLRNYLKTKLAESKAMNLNEGLNYIIQRYPTFEIQYSE